MVARTVALLEVLLCSSVPTQLAIVGVLRAAGIPTYGAGGQLSFPFVVIVSLGDAALLTLLMASITRAHGESVSELWLGRVSTVREAVLGLLLVPVLFVLVVALLNALRVTAPWLHNVETNPLEQLAATPGNAAIFAVVAIVAGGVREELQRAFLLRRFERHLGGAFAGIVVLSLAFGFGHYVQGWDAVITTAVLGALWAAIYVRRRSVVAPLVSHSGFNSLEVLRVVVWGP